MTRQLATALVRASDLVGPAAEATEHWLEAKDNSDPDLIAEAREELDAALIDASDLWPTMTRLLRLTQTRS